MPVGSEPEIVTLFEQLVDVLTRLDIRYAFIGAMARNTWGRPRTTTDLDLEMALDDAALRSLEEALRASGVFREGEVGPTEPGDTIPDILVFRSSDGIRVDILVTKTQFQRRAIERRVAVNVFHRTAWVVTPEDLIVYKLIAGRPRDMDDVEDVLESRTAAEISVEWEYISGWAKAWEVMDRWEPFLRRFGPDRDRC